MGLLRRPGGALAGVVVDVWGYDVLNAAAGDGLVLAVAVMAAGVGRRLGSAPSAGPADLRPAAVRR